MEGQQSVRRLKDARPRLLLLVLFFYVITNILELLEWIIDLRTEDYETVDPGALTAYIAFTAAGLFVFLFISSPLIYWPYHYGSEMSPKARRNMFSIAIVLMFVVHDFAKTWLGIYIAITVGFKNMLQTVCLFLSMICFAVGFFTTWISYTWKMSKMLQIRYGYAAANHTLKASAMAKSEHTGGI